MKITELRQKSKEELRTLLQEKKSRIDELRFLLHQKKVKNVKETASVKKDIARILTLIKEVEADRFAKSDLASLHADNNAERRRSTRKVSAEVRVKSA